MNQPSQNYNTDIYPTPQEQRPNPNLNPTPSTPENNPVPKKRFPFGYLIAFLMILTPIIGWVRIGFWIFAIELAFLLIAVVWAIIDGRKNSTESKHGSPTRAGIYIIWGLLSLLVVYIAFQFVKSIDTSGLGIGIAGLIILGWIVISSLVIWAAKRAK